MVVAGAVMYMLELHSVTGEHGNDGAWPAGLNVLAGQEAHSRLLKGVGGAVSYRPAPHSVTAWQTESVPMSVDREDVEEMRYGNCTVSKLIN